MSAGAVDGLVKAAAEAHSNLTTYGAIIALLEGGTIYGGREARAQRIISACKKAMQYELRHYDRAMTALAAQEARRHV